MAFVRKYWLIISLVGLILTVVITLSNPYASSASFEQKLDLILPKDRNNVDFIKTIISLSALADPDTDIDWTEKELEVMSGTLKKAIGEQGNPEKIINVFNKYFFEQEGFIFDKNFTAVAENGGEVSAAELRNFHSIEKTMKRKQGICLSISLIYLMLGDKLQLPLYGVLIPGHIYVRYKESDRAGINIETTVSGREYYGYLDGSTGAGTAYGRELDKYSVIGAYLLNPGNYFISTGQFRKARVVFSKSIEMLPDAAEGYINMGVLYEAEHKTEPAVLNYEKALLYLPDSGFAHYRLGAIYLMGQRFTKAQSHLEEAVKTNTGGDDAVKLLEKAKNKEPG
jgi:tetratricopeptide (TPR) repeat protein